MSESKEDGGAANLDHLRDMHFDDDDGDCHMCGGSGILDDTCVCNAFEDTCCCADPEPMECPECLHQAQMEELAKLQSDSRALLKARQG